MKTAFRTVHRKVAPILFLPLLLTTLTGLGYRLGNSWFNIPGGLADKLMAVHEGAFFGQALVPVYVLATGLGLLGLCITGLTMVRRLQQSPLKAKRTLAWRLWHQVLTPIFVLPVILTAVTGIVYRVGKNWFGMSKETAGIFLKLHQGTYFGQTLRPFYVLFVGVGLLALLITGINMVKLFRQVPPASLTNQGQKAAES